MVKIKLVSASEAANKLGVHLKTASRLMREQKMGAIKVANRWVVDEATLEEFAKTYVGKKGRPKGWSPKREAGK
jgi:excisionase family DNA binding protein